jgi:hypothetical protein
MPMQLVPIVAQERKLGDVFSDDYAFEIPAYQRPYAWEKEQAVDLLTDILAAMKDKSTSGGVYFLGSVVLIKSPNDPQSKVIDGQQRLTTLTILLSVLRDLTTDDENRIGRRQYVFQKANKDRGTDDRFRVLLRPRDRGFFRKTIQEPGATNALPDVETLDGSQYRIAANARYFREQLDQMPEAERDSLVAFLIQNCYLVVVAVPNAESARRIFTVLNARGLNLTPTDILKATLLDRVSDASESLLAERWENIESRIGREELVELFGHIRMIYEREKPRLDLETGFLKFVAPFNGEPDKFVSDVLEPIADAFGLLKESDSIKRLFGPEVAKAIRSLNRIDNKDWIPPALQVLWKRKPEEKEKTALFFIQLERLAYYLFVTRAGVNERISRFAAVMNERDGIAIDKKNGLALSDHEQVGFLDDLDGDIYKKTRVCKAVLQRLDEALSSGGASYDDLVSIEHVLPQTVDADSEWAHWFPLEITRDEWTHRLGNLVFLTRSINTKASNWDFKKKKEKYFATEDGSSPFVITQQVLQTESWTADHLETRQEKLLRKLADVWALDFSKFQSVDGFSEEEQEPLNEKGGATDTALIEEKRQKVIKAFSQREGILLNRTSAAAYSSDDGKYKAIFTISKRYPTGSPYWYGFAPRWNEYLAKGKTSFVVLGCMDRDHAYAIPLERIQKLLPHLHRTGDRHWHLALEESDSGQIELAVPKAGSRIGMTEFEVKLDDEPTE